MLLKDKMKFIFVVILLIIGMRAQSFTVSNPRLPDAPGQTRFWTTEKKVEAGVLAGLVAADGITTQRGLNEGLREANPLMRPFVTRGAAGEAAGSALGFGAGIGLVYLFHRSHHHGAERVALRMMVVCEGGFVVNNIVVLR